MGHGRPAPQLDVSHLSGGPRLDDLAGLRWRGHDDPAPIRQAPERVFADHTRDSVDAWILLTAGNVREYHALPLEPVHARLGR